MKKIIIFAGVILISSLTHAQDWANLNRYMQANSELNSLKPDENRVVFMGNSITEGWLHFRPEFFKNKSYINRGIGGQTTPQMLIRFRQDVIDLEPVVVVILAGINDIAGNTGPTNNNMIFDNIKSMSELALANNIKVVLCSVLPANQFSWALEKPAERILELNNMIKSYVEERDLVYADYFTAMADDQSGLKQELGVDSVHPNKEGYLVMEPIIEKAIHKALSNSTE